MNFDASLLSGAPFSVSDGIKHRSFRCAAVLIMMSCASLSL
jgi:hypothetical protein